LKLHKKEAAYSAGAKGEFGYIPRVRDTGCNPAQTITATPLDDIPAWPQPNSNKKDNRCR